MERKIGEVFDFGGVKLEVFESNLCNGCYFFKGDGHCRAYHDRREVVGGCSPVSRSDGMHVIFKKYGI